jgi:hypothetical protein
MYIERCINQKEGHGKSVMRNGHRKSVILTIPLPWGVRKGRSDLSQPLAICQMAERTMLSFPPNNFNTPLSSIPTILRERISVTAFLFKKKWHSKF